MVRPIQRRKLPWGFLTVLLVLMLILAYLLSGLMKLDGVTLLNWQNRFAEVLLHPFQNWWNEKSIAFLGIAFFAWFGMVTYLMDNYRNRQAGVEHGAEEWADLKQIRRILTDKDETKNTLLSENVAVANDKLSNLNMLVVGGAGSYKTTSVVMRNLQLAAMTNVFLDIKGELLRKNGNYLKEHGIAVKSLNFINMEQSDRWNPFNYIHSEKDLVKIVTNLQESVKPPDAMKGEPFWDEASGLYLMSLFAYEWFRQEEEKKEHPKHYQVATLPRVVELANMEMQPGSREDSTKLQEKMEELERKHGRAYPPVRDYFKLKGAAEAKETISSVILMVNAMLRLCETPELKRILEEDDIDIKSLGTGADHIPGKKTALFLVMPDNDPSFNFLISMFYTTMYDVLLYTADHECGGKLPIHVRLWADEFYAGPKPTRTEVLMGTIRGRNMSIVPILQSIAQAQALFPQNKWEIFVENCAVMVYLGSGPGAKSTHEYISKLLGDMTIDTRDDGRSFGSHGNSNIQNRKSGRTLMTPAEVRRMSRKDCLIFIEGQYPIFDRKAIPFRTKRWMEAEKLAGKNGYRHPVEVVFDEETRSYITVQQKEKIEFLTKEEKEIYRQLAKTDENLHYWEVDADAFLYMNFRRPQPTEEEIEQIFQQAKKEKDALRQLQNTEEELPEDIQAMLQQEKPDLSGSIIECIERYQKELSAEQKEILINSLVLGLTEKQVKNMFFQPKERMEKLQKAYLFQNLPFRNSEQLKYFFGWGSQKKGIGYSQNAVIGT